MGGGGSVDRLQLLTMRLPRNATTHQQLEFLDVGSRNRIQKHYIIKKM